ncbi:hypothetical protein, partial [Streptomyces sp. IB201691-2A2]|uniref:hypothetical protein n=1 Tax=Streptomyces sp. IB201691-2A2 TaxID=2561920 RepID=UPI001CA75ABF
MFTAAWLRTGTLPIDPAAGGDALERLRSSLAAAVGIGTALVLVWLLWRPLILTASALEALWKLLVAQPAQRIAAWIRSKQTDRDDEAGVRPRPRKAGGPRHDPEPLAGATDSTIWIKALEIVVHAQVFDELDRVQGFRGADTAVLVHGLGITTAATPRSHRSAHPAPDSARRADLLTQPPHSPALKPR